MLTGITTRETTVILENTCAEFAITPYYPQACHITDLLAPTVTTSQVIYITILIGCIEVV